MKLEIRVVLITHVELDSYSPFVVEQGLSAVRAIEYEQLHEDNSGYINNLLDNHKLKIVLEVTSCVE